MRFVFRVNFITFAGPGRIDGADEVRGFQVEDGEEVASDAENGIGWLSAGARHGGDGVKHLKHQRKSVNDVETIASHCGNLPINWILCSRFGGFARTIPAWGLDDWLRFCRITG